MCSSPVALPLEIENRFFVLDAQGNRILCIVELNSSLSRTCFGRHRPFILQVLDGQGRLILEIQRRCSCLLCYCGAGAYGSVIMLLKTQFCSISCFNLTAPSVLVQNVNATLQTANGEVLGRVLQSCSCITPAFAVINHEGQQIFKVSGPRWSSCFRYRLLARNLEFSIVDSKDGNIVGAVIKGYSHNQHWSDPNDFGLRIEKAVDARNKALLIGAVFAVGCFTAFTLPPLLVLSPTCEVDCYFCNFQHYSYLESGNESCFGSFFCCRCTDCTGLKATLWFLVFAILFAILMLVMLKVRAIV